MTPFRNWLAQSPFVAILRGITPAEAIAVGEALWNAGWRIIEVPLNSPEPFESIRRLQRHFGDRILLGAGTVRRLHEVDTLHATGARLMVCPHTDAALIRQAVSLDMFAMPGVATASECMQALDAGADALKLFPADALGVRTLAALRPVLPSGTIVLPVGGIAADNLHPWLAAGAAGFGIGGTLYRPGTPPEQVGRVATRLTESWRIQTTPTS